MKKRHLAKKTMALASLAALVIGGGGINWMLVGKR